MEILRTIATYVLVHAKSCVDEACTLYSATNVADKGKKNERIFMIKIKEKITYIYLTLHEPIDNLHSHSRYTFASCDKTWVRFASSFLLYRFNTDNGKSRDTAYIEKYGFHCHHCS